MKYNKISSRKFRSIAFITFSLLVISLMSVIFPAAVIADGTSPVIVSPQNGATDVEVTGLSFSWEAFDEFTTGYIFQLASDVDFTTLIADEEVYALSYTYSDTLGYSTDYYWRVQAYDPNPSAWTEATFTTKSLGTNGGDSSTANTTDDSTSSTSGGESFIDSVISYLSEIGWPLVGGMAFVLIVLIVLVSMLLSKPKKSTPPGMGGAAMRPGMGPQNQCPSCGTMNAPERKFCSNCGGNLMAGPAFQQKQAPASPSGTICQNCGSPIAPGRQFCGVCGNKIMPPQQQPGFQTAQFTQSNNCTVCGSPLQTGQQFCGNCGTNLAAGQQQWSTSYQTEMFMCPICGASINKGMNPCPSCNTWLDWGK